MGKRSTIPAKIKSETPLPILFSVINSPSHTKNIVPAVMVKIAVINDSPFNSPIKEVPPLCNNLIIP